MHNISHTHFVILTSVPYYKNTLFRVQIMYVQAVLSPLNFSFTTPENIHFLKLLSLKFEHRTFEPRNRRAKFYSNIILILTLERFFN